MSEIDLAARLAMVEGRMATAEARLGAAERTITELQAAKPLAIPEGITEDTHPTIEDALRLHCHGMSPETRRVTRRAVLHRFAAAQGSTEERATTAVAYLQHGEIETVRAYLES